MPIFGPDWNKIAADLKLALDNVMDRSAQLSSSVQPKVDNVIALLRATQPLLQASNAQHNKMMAEVHSTMKIEKEVSEDVSRAINLLTGRVNELGSSVTSLSKVLEITEEGLSATRRIAEEEQKLGAFVAKLDELLRLRGEMGETVTSFKALLANMTEELQNGSNLVARMERHSGEATNAIKEMTKVETGLLSKEEGLASVERKLREREKSVDERENSLKEREKEASSYLSVLEEARRKAMERIEEETRKTDESLKTQLDSLTRSQMENEAYARFLRERHSILVEKLEKYFSLGYVSKKDYEELRKEVEEVPR